MLWNVDPMQRISQILFAALLLLPAPLLMGVPSRESLANLFAQGNAEYQKGDFASAERSYRQMLDAGVDSGSLYYNLGNVCFKQKKLGEAIYNWEKAKQKLPGDPDVKENLDLANLMVVDRIEVPPDPFPVRLFRRAQEILSATQATRTVLILFVITNSLFSVYLFARNPGLCYRALIGGFIAGVLVLLMGCSLAWRLYDESHRQEAIVVEQKTDVRSGPGTENITIFTVHEGIKVRVRGEANGWYQVSLPNGWNGWLQQSALRIL